MSQASILKLRVSIRGGPVLPRGGGSASLGRVSQLPSSHVIDDYVHIDVHTVRAAASHHLHKFLFSPGATDQLVRHRLIPCPPARIEHLTCSFQGFRRPFYQVAGL